ncbi:protein cereblon isoform X2 [Chrysoperla carnea]|uniref:protein cereblon isoform X2 n=1 Tax=Chrysoperla carnea TaxID=189513 RepID=UPI001D093D1B|nr:protein cereblon isoform X2 [Chrysoperla carnea]
MENSNNEPSDDVEPNRTNAERGLVPIVILNALSEAENAVYGLNNEQAAEEGVQENETDDDDENVEDDNYYLNGFVEMREEINLSDDDNSHEEQQEVVRTFDTSLPTEHAYLGNDLEYLRGRVLFEDYQIVRLQILPGDAIVCPGYTLPFTFYQYRSVIQQILQKDKTFGLTYSLGSRYNIMNLIGVTMEIFEYAETPHEIKIKAKGRQRFRVLDIDPKSSPFEHRVQILPEVDLPHPLNAIQFDSLNKFRLHVQQDKSTFKHNQFFRCRDAIQTRWPLWVFTSYDEDYLVTEIFDLLKNFKEILPRDPLKLSYWVIQNFLLSTAERIEALKFNSSVQRLRFVLNNMRNPRYISCSQCQSEFAGQEDLFPMSKDGLQNNFVNPGGVVHETITVLRAHRISLIGQPQVVYSWFPGYAWTIAQCSVCTNHHIGWRFTATTPDLLPQKFYGLTRSSVMIKTIKNDKSV